MQKMQPLEPLSLNKLREGFNEDLSRYIERLGKEPLGEICQYSLEGGGKRLRPLLVFIIALGIDRGFDVTKAALAVECFHTASLIVDDLPCMDNDNFRRGKKSCHKVFGEKKALLASYALMSEAYAKIYESTAVLHREIGDRAHFIGMQALRIAAQNAGLAGATSGQLMDLSQKSWSFPTLLEVARRKTVSLFEIAFGFGYLFGGGDWKCWKQLQSCAYHFGLSFQAIDDLDDCEKDRKRGGANMAICIGMAKTVEFISTHVDLFAKGMRNLGLYTPLVQDLEESVRQSASRSF